MNQIDKAIGAKIKQRRTENGLSAKVVADALGVSAERLLDMEAGRLHLTAAQFFRVCQKLNVQPNYFFSDITV